MILQNISDLNINFTFQEEIDTNVLYEKLKCNKIIFLVSREEIILPSTFVAIYADEFIRTGISYQDYEDKAVKISFDFIRSLKVNELEVVYKFMNEITKEICYSLILKDFLAKTGKSIFEDYGLLTLIFNPERESYKLSNEPKGENFFSKIKFFEVLQNKERILNLLKINKENYSAAYFKNLRISFGLSNVDRFYPAIPYMLREVENTGNKELEKRLKDFEHSIEADKLEENNTDYASDFLQSEFAVDVFLFDEKEKIGSLSFLIENDFDNIKDDIFEDETVSETFNHCILKVNKTNYMVTSNTKITEEPFEIEI